MPPSPRLGSEIVRDARGHIVDIYVQCVASAEGTPLPEPVLKALARQGRKAKPVLN